MHPDPRATESPPADLSELYRAEWAALHDRRHMLCSPATHHGSSEPARPAAHALPRVGLALSGGGVRSATFGLGLLRGMAQHGSAPGTPTGDSRMGVLGRVDYLSTVSGGGYVGAMWTRLVMRHGWAQAQAILADGSSSTLEWLRRYGRYLTPAGSRDFGVALVTYTRALLAIHIEFMVACLFLGLVVTAPHLWQHTLRVLTPDTWERWPTLWWSLAAVLAVLCAPGLMTAYWTARDSPTHGAQPGALRRAMGWRDSVLLLVLAGTTWAVLYRLHAQGALDWVRSGMGGPSLAAIALLSAVVGPPAAQLRLALARESQGVAVARLRNQLTRALRLALLAAGALAALGALDRLSWWVLEELQSGNAWLWNGLGAGSLALIGLRHLMQPLQQLAAEAGARARSWLPRLLDCAGYLGLLVLVLAWLVAFQWFVFVPDALRAFADVPAWLRATLVASAWALWVLLTACSEQMANSSSLHSFYRARLTRAYLAVGNPTRDLAQHAPAHHATADVTAVVAGDDTALCEHRVEAQGGPIHLINVCLNQTRDDQSGLYNADRKGCLVTASWRGLELGTQRFIPTAASGPTHATGLNPLGTLGRWIAISGAAASPGAGSYTSRGLALLVYFLGVRLGQWHPAPSRATTRRGLRRWAWRGLTKPMMLASEAAAVFFGQHEPWWYLSDGGHFDNTGVYPLLKRELDFIVLSDASGDKRYGFADIEHLVRKARIDLGADIDFYTRAEAAELFCLAGSDLTVIAPEDMANNHSHRGVLLARIRYRARPSAPPAGSADAPAEPQRPEGTLLVVKANLHGALDVDVLAYAREHPDFPHESTGDQSFDEAQWESYHRLGEDFGRALHENWLAQLPGWRGPARHGLRTAARLRANAPVAASASDGPWWRRASKAAAIGTTLGLGASGTLLLSLWQMQEHVQQRRTSAQAEVKAILGEASIGLQALDGACPRLADHVVTQSQRVLELRGSPKLGPLEQGGLDRLVERMARECRKAARREGDCIAAHERFGDDLCTQLKKATYSASALNYWNANVTPQDQALQARQTWQQLRALWRGPAVLLASTTEAVAPPPPPPAEMGHTEADAAPDTTPSGADPVPPGPTHPVSAAAAARTALSDRLVAACARHGTREPTQLYVQVYDEDTLRAANQWRESLRKLPGTTSLRVAAVENVTLSAELREQRRPVPWPKPTWLLHQEGSRACAQALSTAWATRAVAQAPPSQGGRSPAAATQWIRVLPDNQPGRRSGVIELWWPAGAEGAAR